MINSVVRSLLAKNDWSRIIFRFPTSSYTLFNSDRYEIDSFCIYIHDDTSREYEETKVLDIASLISMEIKKKNFEDIVEEM
jgi:hypothetical protein|nr:MAG TPA: hypothetical protein [Caudoviricetes sp.]